MRRGTGTGVRVEVVYPGPQCNRKWLGKSFQSTLPLYANDLVLVSLNRVDTLWIVSYIMYGSDIKSSPFLRINEAKISRTSVLSQSESRSSVGRRTVRHPSAINRR